MDPITRVVARRIARVVFGTVLLAGMATLAMAAPLYGDCGCGWRSPPIHAWQILAVTWLAAGGAALFAWSVARNVHFTKPTTLQRAGLAVPAAGLACALPLTLHAPVVVLLGGDTQTFDFWVIASLIVTGIPHLIFAAAVLQRGCELGTTGISRMTTKRVFGWVLIASCIPWIAAFGLPPLIVMVTLLPCMIPIAHMEPLARAERDWLATAGLPPAIALRAPLSVDHIA